MMTHRDRANVPSGRKQTAGDDVHRQGLLTPADGVFARPERHILPAPGLRRISLPMHRIAARTASGRGPGECVSMDHYHYSLV